MFVEKKNILIFGAGKSGLSAARLLKKNDYNVLVYDEKIIASNILKQLDNLKIPYIDHLLLKDLDCDELFCIVLSPGILLSHPYLLKYIKKGLLIVSEIEIASWFVSKESFLLGVTGTNGKSTTTHYAAQLLSNQEKKSIPCGNIGLPFSDAIISSCNPEDSFVIELSSYQLESTYSLLLDGSILLNIQNDHLERYENMNEYLKAKWRILLLTKDTGFAIIDKEVFFMGLQMGLSLPKCSIYILLSVNEDLLPLKIVKNSNLESKINHSYPIAIYKDLKQLNADDWISYLKLGTSYIYENDQQQLSVYIVSSQEKYNLNFLINKSCLMGKHNAINILAASIAGLHKGIPLKHIIEQWEYVSSSYQQLSHRLEIITGKTVSFYFGSSCKNILFINDSKATNVESTLVALKAVKGRIHLLLGGQAKGDSYQAITEFIGKNLIKIYPFGAARFIIESELSNFHHNLAPSFYKLLDAACYALEQCHDGDTILLSPACSSFDEFMNFEHRGDTFRNWVLSLIKEDN